MKETYIIDTKLFKQAVKETGIEDHKQLLETGLKVLIEHAENFKKYNLKYQSMKRL